VKTQRMRCDPQIRGWYVGATNTNTKSRETLHKEIKRTQKTVKTAREEPAYNKRSAEQQVGVSKKKKHTAAGGERGERTKEQRRAQSR